MEFIDHFIIPPNGHYLQLLEFLAVMTYLIHLPYVGLLLGTTVLSMWLTFSNHEIPNPRFERFAGDLIDAFLGNRVAMIVLGLLPLVILPIIYTQWFVGSGAQPLKYIPLALPVVALAMGALVLYQKSYASRATNFRNHMLMGLSAVGLLKLGYLILIASVVRLQDPEKWYRVKDVLIMVLNFNVIWKFVFFLHAAGAITGAAILFFFFRWADRGIGDPDYERLVKRFGGGIALAFTLALPVFQLFYVFTTPDVAFDNGVYLLAAALIFVAMIAAISAVSSLASQRGRYASTLLMLVLAVFLISATGDMRSMAVANFEHAHVLARTAEEGKAAREAEIEATLHAAGGADVGERVFKEVCSLCHKFDERLVGPPLNTVLPKYAGDVDKLVRFIGNPVKVDDGNPPMPKPAVTPSEARAVAEYLLGQIGGESAPSGQGGH